MKRIISAFVLLKEISVPTLSEPKLLADYRHGVLDLITTGATGVVKVQVSNQEQKPDFSVPCTTTNLWTYIDLVCRDDGGSNIVGTTGIPLTADTSHHSYAINSDAIRWVSVDVEALSAGSLSVLLSGATNE